MKETCDKGLYPLVEIEKIYLGIDTYKIIQWCPICRAIVVDLKIDNNLKPDYFLKLQYPKITKLHYHNEHNEK